jgi:cytochrome P450|tara:strand:+ start:548 stop:1639 length:1092 start_codon:yes stop_codon:yes gene_type:complete
VPALNSWLVTKWDDVIRVTTDIETFTAVDKKAPVVRHFGDPAIIHVDGTVHRELRKGIAPHYAANKVTEYIDHIVRPIARECIAAFPENGEIDLLATYFEPISALTLTRTFGVMDADIETLRRWFHGLAMGAINFGRDAERTAICEKTKAEINEAFDPIFDALEAEPNDTPISHLLYHGMPEGERRAREYVMPTILVTLLAGMQEPGHGAANTLVGLLEHPDQMALVRSDIETHLKKAVSEGIRWVAPIGTQGRSPMKDVEIREVHIPAGATISAVIASANHDEEIYPSGDVFDMTREHKQIATFGFGPHFCAGKWMSLAQMELALRILLEEFSEITLDQDKPHAFSGWEFRAPNQLYVKLTK